MRGILLFPFTLLYGIIIALRNRLFDLGIFRAEFLPTKVISIGNMTAGGTGKTPHVILLAKELQKRGLAVAVLSRGYKRQSRNTVQVPMGQRVHNDWKLFGDEPVLMTRKLTDVPVVVDGNRVRGGKFILKNFNPDLILLDDGFQHRALHRDYDIVLINSNVPSSAWHLLPSGHLREPWNQIRRASMIIISKSNLQTLSRDLMAKLDITGKPVCRSEIHCLENLYGAGNRSMEISSIKGKTAILISAIGDPAGFEKIVAYLGISIAGHSAFRDHYDYTAKDLNRVIDWFIDSDSKMILTTEKDFIKIEPFIDNDLPLFAVPIEVKFSDQNLNTILDEIISIPQTRS
jgi:tetraacyldisaccharide 4'-kinase